MDIKYAFLLLICLLSVSFTGLQLENKGEGRRKKMFFPSLTVDMTFPPKSLYTKQKIGNEDSSLNYSSRFSNSYQLNENFASFSLIIPTVNMSNTTEHILISKDI